jgi:hypothetical protein
VSVFASTADVDLGALWTAFDPFLWEFIHASWAQRKEKVEPRRVSSVVYPKFTPAFSILSFSKLIRKTKGFKNIQFGFVGTGAGKRG